MTVHKRVTAARKRLGVPALGAAVLSADGTLASRVDGLRRRGRDEPATLEDQWHIGSCGKSMTAALYARLVEAGRATWSASVVELFGDLNVHQSWSTVTIDHLLLCTSGAPANIEQRRFVAYLRDERPPVDQRTELAAELFAHAPQGTGEFRYSNLGYTVAGAAIERITGEPYESALHTHLFQPLEITTAGFGPPPALWGHEGRLRFGSLILGRGAAVNPTYFAADNPTVMSPAGRMHLTIADWSKFLRLFLVDAEKPALAPATVERLLTLGPGGRMAMGWAPAQGIGAVSFGQQGSNTNWVASALLDQDRRRAAMVVVNDGRTSLLMRTARMAADILTAD